MEQEQRALTSSSGEIEDAIDGIVCGGGELFRELFGGGNDAVGLTRLEVRATSDHE